GQAARRLVELGQPLVDARSLSELELERAPGRAQRLVDAREHPPEPVGAVGREQPKPLGVAAGAEACERPLERLAAQDGPLRLVELAEAWVDPDLERVRPEQPGAEPVDGRDPRAVERTGEVLPTALDERRPDPRAELAGRLARIRDHEHGLDVEPRVADGADEALDEDGRLARAGAGRDE